MTALNHNKALTNVRNSIKSHRLGVALRSLRKLASNAQLFNYTSDFETIDNSYRSMQDYMLNGGSDPERPLFIDNLCARLYQLSDQIERDIVGIDSPELYYSKMRLCRIKPQSIADMVTQYMTADDNNDTKAERESLLNNIFDKIWSTFPIEAGDLSLLVDIASDEANQFELRSQIISALMLGVIQYFERARILALIEIYHKSTSLMITARALTALIISIYLNNERVFADHEILVRLTELAESQEDSKNIREVIFEIIKALDTERINKALRDDIMPAMTKLKPGIDKIFKSGENFSLDGEINPQWEELMESSGLNDKLRKFSEMQEEGADMMMLAFSNLKSFDFFKDVSNWFLPFDTTHTYVTKANGGGSDTILALLETPGMMCDSDKYSFIFSLSKAPEAQKNMIADQLKAQENQLRDSIAELSLMETDTKMIFKREVVRYIRNLNRFFKLFRLHTQFKDVFRHPFLISNIPVYGAKVLSDNEQLRVIGEFYLRRGYYHEALELLQKLESLKGSDSSLLEKIGFCLQRLGNYAEALTEYKKAELFNPDSTWLLKHIAHTARLTGNYADAAEYYQQILNDDSANVGLMMNLAHCLIELGQEAEALKLYYKIAYLKPDHFNAIRGIAWVEFIIGNFDKSLDYHNQVLMSADAQLSDYINAGHASLAKADYRDAIEKYIFGIKLSPDKIEGVKEFVKIMKTDRDTLIKSGIDANTIDIITDYVITSF